MSTTKLGVIPPRLLKFRHQFTIYFRLLLAFTFCVVTAWAMLFFMEEPHAIFSRYTYEFIFSCLQLVAFTLSYFFWWRLKLQQTIQVFEDRLIIHRQGKKVEVLFSDVASVSIVGWSLFYFFMKSGEKFYFNSTLERVDYIWEGIYFARPDLMTREEYENYRVKLVQYDHHQKRKEWFFKHRLIDVLNWCILPLCFMGTIYFVQSKELHIYQPFYYFFRLLMYSLLTLLTTAFFYNIAIKKLVFDKKVEDQLEVEPNDKIRDLEYENVIIQRTKFVQSISVIILFGLIVKTDFNMFTLTKVRGDYSAFNLVTGKTLVVDNRYNCSQCKFSVEEGDTVIFSKGQIGQILAKPGDLVGQVAETSQGRSIASESVTLVPEGHVAIQLANSEEIMVIKESELVGRLQN